MVECMVTKETTLSARNQIVLPREAREALGVKSGDKIRFVVQGSRVLELQKVGGPGPKAELTSSAGYHPKF